MAHLAKTSRDIFGRLGRFIERRSRGLVHRIAAWRMPAEKSDLHAPESVSERFYNLPQWQDWLAAHPPELRTAMTSRLLRLVRTRGLSEPLTGRRFRPSEIAISTGNLRESLVAGGINARMRALLACIEREAPESSKPQRLLAAEAVTPFADVLRRHFPNFVGTEYLPNEEDRLALPGVQHLDIQEMHFADASFDFFVSGDVIEHVPDPAQAVAEIARVLAPGGVVLSTFPFLSEAETTVVKASIGDDGEIVHHAEPEYHGNPVDVEGGALVFTVPAWDVLDLYRRNGFEEVCMLGLYSAGRGIISHDTPLVHVLFARKAAGATEKGM